MSCRRRKNVAFITRPGNCPPARKFDRGRRAYDKTRVFIAFLLAYKFSLFHVVRAYIRACVFSAFRANIFFPLVFTKKTTGFIRPLFAVLLFKTLFICYFVRLFMTKNAATKAVASNPTLSKPTFDEQFPHELPVPGFSGLSGLSGLSGSGSTG